MTHKSRLLPPPRCLRQTSTTAAPAPAIMEGRVETWWLISSASARMAGRGRRATPVRAALALTFSTPALSAHAGSRYVRMAVHNYPDLLRGVGWCAEPGSNRVQILCSTSNFSGIGTLLDFIYFFIFFTFASHICTQISVVTLERPAHYVCVLKWKILNFAVAVFQYKSGSYFREILFLSTSALESLWPVQPRLFCHNFFFFFCSIFNKIKNIILYFFP